MELGEYITGFGDVAVLLPVALCVALFFVLAGWWRGGAGWVIGVGGTLAVALTLKLLLFACGLHGPLPMLRSPSGHTAAATVVIGTLVALAVWRATGRAGWAFACAIPAGLIIGATRLSLGLHNGVEIFVGGVVGSAGAAAILAMAGPLPAGIRMTPLAGICVLFMLALHGYRLPAEAMIRGVAIELIAPAYCHQRMIRPI